MPDLSPAEILEVEADLRRRTSEALRLGSRASRAAAKPASAGALLAGLAIGIAIILAVGVIAIAQGPGGLNGAGRSPSPVANPTHSP
jgi:hypothetical protein